MKVVLCLFKGDRAVLSGNAKYGSSVYLPTFLIPFVVDFNLAVKNGL